MKESKVKTLDFRDVMLSEGSLRESLSKFLGRIGEELALNTISRLNLLADLIAELEGLLVRLNKVEEELSRVFFSSCCGEYTEGNSWLYRFRLYE